MSMPALLPMSLLGAEGAIVNRSLLQHASQSTECSIHQGLFSRQLQGLQDPALYRISRHPRGHGSSEPCPGAQSSHPYARKKGPCFSVEEKSLGWIGRSALR